MSFELHILRGMSIHRYTKLLTKDKEDDIIPKQTQPLRAAIAERISPNILKIKGGHNVCCGVS